MSFIHRINGGLIGRSALTAVDGSALYPSVPYYFHPDQVTQSGLISFSAAQVVNRNTASNAFHTDSSAIGSWLLFDTVDGADFEKVSVYLSGSNVYATWAIQYSDNNSSWTTVAENFNVLGAAGYKEISWPSAGLHRYWRLYKTNSAQGGAYHNEVSWYWKRPEFASTITRNSGVWSLSDMPLPSLGGGGATGSGGTVTNFQQSGKNWRCHTFTSLGTSAFTFGGGIVDLLVVAGGGAGGTSHTGGGGGGGGGVVYLTELPLAGGSYDVFVGNGGTPNTGPDAPGNNGQDSYLGTIRAYGGGGGGCWGGNGKRGRNGGSGGGGEENDSNKAGNPVPGQGFKGGGGDSPGDYPSGGGGGAGGAGLRGYANKGGNGGDGALISISGSNTYYGAGGGGGTYNGGFGGVGGRDCGGRAGNGGGGNGTSGTANRGGGGGGNGGNGGPSASNAYSGGNGGSGIVIVRYEV